MSQNKAALRRHAVLVYFKQQQANEYTFIMAGGETIIYHPRQEMKQMNLFHSQGGFKCIDTQFFFSFIT